MSYTNHFGQPQGHALSFVNKIREALIAEIVAINGYENHIANSNMKDINAVWHHIVQDEKDHYGMFLNLVEKYDPEEYQQSLKHRKDNIMVEAMQKYEPEYDKQIILNNIREDIKGEFEAIILYEQLVNEFIYDDVKDVFITVIRDEKEHAEHLTQVLLKYDPDKYNNFK